jgi:hypothetical protein
MIPELTRITLTSHGANLEQAPRYTGVYRFFDAQGNLLYVGKSVDIKARLQQHFLEARKPGRHQRIMLQVTTIDCTATAGEVGALLMENAAIKAETPLYNRRQRRLRKLWTLQLRHANNGFLQPHATDFLPDAERTADSYGLFQNPRHIDSSLRRHARDHGLCLRMLGLDKGRGPCFQFQLGRCDGACAGEESSDDHNARLLSVLDRDRIAAWPFSGALALRELNTQPLPDQPSEQYHWVEHWAYLGSFDSLSTLQGASAGSGQRYFDRDTYHLLLSALRKGRLTLLDASSGHELDNPLLRQGSRS